MRIANNIMAMNTHRQYTINNNAVSKSAEKLSSGYRINRAGDDAAGLAISEKMRSQIRGLNMASKNSQDGNSLIQTAEGALQEVHSMLQRMNELAVQSASGTNQTIDRQALELEFQQLIAEIDDISVQTTFNDMNLLDGTLGGAANTMLTAEITGAGAAITGTNVPAAGAKYTSGTLDFGTATVALNDKFTFEVAYTKADGTAATKSIVVDAAANDDEDAIIGKLKTAFEADADVKDLFTFAAGTGTFNITGKDATDKSSVTGVTLTVTDSADAAHADAAQFDLAAGTTAPPTEAHETYDISTTAWAAGDKVVVDGKTYTYVAGADGSDGETFADNDGLKAALAKNGVTLDLTDPSNATFAPTAAAGGLQIQVGAKRGETMNVSINAMDSTSLMVKALSIATQDGAGAAITAVREAINTVSTQRATLGAAQNRLEHKIANLDTSAENLSAAESRIRDVDLASEMTSFTKNNILSQAATAMLAQANTIPQNVLQLLR